MFSPVLPQLMHSTSLSNTYQFSSRSFESVLEDYHGSTETSLKVRYLKTILPIVNFVKVKMNPNYY